MDRYKGAKVCLANHDMDKAIPILEQLNNDDPTEANINYLLGVCYVKQNEKIDKAISLLEKASAKFHEIYFNPGMGAAQHVYYYLTLAFCSNHDCDKAKESLATFEDEGFSDDTYYMADAKKWVKNCEEQKQTKPEFRDRLVSTTHEVDTQRVEYTTDYTLWGVQVGAYTEPKYTR